MVFLPYGHGLRRTSFAAADVFCIGKRAAPRAFLGHAHHGVFDDRDMLRVKTQLGWCGLGQGAALARGHVLRGHAHMRAVIAAAIDHDAQRVRQL